MVKYVCKRNTLLHKSAIRKGLGYKMKAKRFLSVLLTIVMLAGMIPASAVSPAPITVESADEHVEASTANAELFANTYTVTLDANDGSGTTEEKTVSDGDSITLAGDIFANGICEMLYWNTEPDGSGIPYYIDDNMPVTSDITLYAIWALPLYKLSGYTDDKVEWSGNSASPFNLTIKDGSVIESDIIFPVLSGEDKITITVNGDCEIKGNIAFSKTVTHDRIDLTIKGNGSLKLKALEGTGSGDTLTVETDVTITSNYFFIGASAGESSRIVIKDAALTLYNLTMLQYLTMEGNARLRIENGVASFHSNPVITLSDTSQIYIGGNGFECVMSKERTDNTSYFDLLVTDGWLPAGFSFKEYNYGYYLFDDTDNVETDAITIKKPSAAPATYTVTFKDYDNRVLKTETVEEGSAATAPASPSREGYTFSGWDNDFDNVTSDITVKAKYTVNSYMVSWSKGDGGGYEKQVPYGEVITVPTSQIFLDTVRKTGYTITGWTGFAEGMTMPAQDVTFTAIYKANQYTVSFDTNGGAAISPITVTYGEKYGTLPSSAITGLSGGDSNWYLVDEHGAVTTTKITNLSDVTTSRDHTLKVVRKVLTPTLDIALTAPGCLSDSYQYYNPEDSTRVLTVTVNNMNADVLDYTYKWYKADTLINGETSSVLTLQGNVSDTATYKAEVTASLKNGTGISVTSDTSSGEATKEVKILRLFNTLLYDANGGENAPGEQCSDGATISVTTNEPTRDGYTFTGWNTLADGQGDSYGASSTLTFADDNGNGGCKVTLYAQWQVQSAGPSVNEWTTPLSIENWTYKDTAKAPTAQAKYGTVEFSYSDTIDGVYTEQVPTNAGTYYVKAVVSATSAYTGLSDTKEFKILQKRINPAITLTAPVKNQTPQTEITGDGYTADVTWSPVVTVKFAYNTVYTATITITPDANHTVTGILKDEYTVTGAEKVTNEADSAIATATFAKTGNNQSVIFGGGGGVAKGGDTLQAIRFTVKFKTADGVLLASKEVEKNSKVTPPSVTVDENHTIEGWYKDDTLEIPFNFETKITGNLTLYAKLVEIKKAVKDGDDCDGTASHNCPSLKFSDLDVTKWYHSDTDYVIANGIFKGTTQTTFAPHSSITRAMMITVLYRAEGEPEVTGKATFTDIDTDTYYAKAVIWGQQNGIIKGYSETEYAPEQPILREQIAAIMHRYAIYKGYDVSIGESTNILSYDDSDSISEYAISAMQWAVGSGMIKGRSESTLNPKEYAERVEIAAMLHRFIMANS